MKYELKKKTLTLIAESNYDCYVIGSLSGKVPNEVLLTGTTDGGIKEVASITFDVAALVNMALNSR